MKIEMSNTAVQCIRKTQSTLPPIVHLLYYINNLFNLKKIHSTVRTRKLQNLKTKLNQYLSVFNVVSKQIAVEDVSLES